METHARVVVNGGGGVATVGGEVEVVVLGERHRATIADCPFDPDTLRLTA